MTQKKITPEQEEGNEIIARFEGYKLYKNCKTPTWFYECEVYEWNELDESDIWVKGETELFKQSPCVSSDYWEMKKDMSGKQWEDWTYGYDYFKDWNKLIPVVKKVMNDLWNNDKTKHPKTMIYNTLRSSIVDLEINEVFESVVNGIKLLNDVDL